MHCNRLAITLLCVTVMVSAFAACERNVTTINETYTATACFDCHSDQNTAIVAAEGQWRYSEHGSGKNTDHNRGSCAGCHTNEGFVAKVEGTDPPPTLSTMPTMIHCFTCHAPHTNNNLSLRVTETQTIADGTSMDMNAGNICAACHQARRNVNTYVEQPTDLSDRWGPHHSTETDMYWGSNGYEYAGYTYRRTNHPGVLDDGCLDCHYKEVNAYMISGHSFNMEFVVDGDTLRNTDACEGCHGDQDDFNLNGVQDGVRTLLEDLEARLIAAGLIDDTGDPLNDVTTSQDSAGAVWNYLITEEDGSFGVHNAKYITDLLNSAIVFIQTGPAPPVAGGTDSAEISSSN